MTRLILMRHAKSSWKAEGATDHERTLNKRGRHDAPRMARALVDAGWPPDTALVSDAARTEETWAWMAGELPDTPLTLVADLYLAPAAVIRSVVQRGATPGATVLVLAHNPGIEQAITAFSGEHEVMKTANIALLSHPLEWGVASRRSDWTLERMIRPR